MTDKQGLATQSTSAQVPPEIQAAGRISSPSSGSPELVQTPPLQLEATHGNFAEFHQGYVSHYIELADTKASWAFAIAGGAIAYIVGNSSLQTAVHTGGWPILILSITAISLLLVSATCSFLVIAPRLANTPGEGVVYFGAVSQRASADQYVESIAAKNESQLIEARLKHCYDISKVCTQKYEYLRKAILTGIPALFDFGVLLFVIQSMPKS